MNSHNRKIESLVETWVRSSKTKVLLEKKEELAKKWLNQRKMNTSSRNRARRNLLGKQSNKNQRIEYGHMYFFKYNAKTKETMDYWDEYPLIIPFGAKGSLIYGLNLHYIPPRIRAGIIDMFKQKDGTLMPLEATVKSMADNPIFKPAIHSYYPNLMVGDVQMIEPEDWENVIFLPLANFRSDKKSGRVDSSVQQVYRDYYNRMSTS